MSAAKKRSPHVGGTPAWGTKGLARGSFLHPYPRCQLRGDCIVDKLPVAPCPLREHHPADALLVLKDQAFLSIGHGDSHDLRVYECCENCMAMIRCSPHHREHIHWLRESVNSRTSAVTPSKPESWVIALPVRAETKSSTPTNGKPVIEIAPNLIHRRRKPANVR